MLHPDTALLVHKAKQQDMERLQRDNRLVRIALLKPGKLGWLARWLRSWTLIRFTRPAKKSTVRQTDTMKPVSLHK